MGSLRLDCVDLWDTLKVMLGWPALAPFSAGRLEMLTSGFPGDAAQRPKHAASRRRLLAAPVCQNHWPGWRARRLSSEIIDPLHVRRMSASVSAGIFGMKGSWISYPETGAGRCARRRPVTSARRISAPAASALPRHRVMAEKGAATPSRNLVVHSAAIGAPRRQRRISSPRADALPARRLGPVPINPWRSLLMRRSMCGLFRPR